jgi:outer membrane protein assembly factor BamB
MKIISAIAIAAIAAGSCFSLPVRAAADMGNFQLDAAHDGQVRFKKDFHAPLKQKWLRDLGGNVSYPVSGSGLVFVTVNAANETLYALRPNTGDTVWQKTLTGSGGTPVYDNGRVLVLSDSGFVQTFAARDGTPGWSKQIPSESSFMAANVASGGSFYTTGAGSGVLLYAYNEKTGKLRWTQEGPGGNSTPAIADGGVFVTYPCHDYRYDARNGHQDWADTGGCDGGGGGTPVYYGGLIFLYDGIDRVVLDAQTGALVRQFVLEKEPPAFWTPSSGSPLGFVVTNTGLTAFDPQTGNTAWSYANGNISVPPLVINDTVFVGDSSGTIYALDALNGSQSWSKNVGSTMGDFTFQLGMGAANNMLLVPAGTTISAWVPSRK